MNAGIPVIANPKVTRHILSAFRLRASKRLGQNFLVDAGIVRSIVGAAELAPGDTVLEIGPGIGTLTQGLAETGARVVAVDIVIALQRLGKHAQQFLVNLNGAPRIKGLRRTFDCRAVFH